MTASNASTTRNRAGVRRLLGRRGAAVAAIGAAGALTLSACGAGQLTQTDTQVSAVTGSSVQSADGTISVNDIQLVLATEKAVQDNGPFHLVFTAANSSPSQERTLEQITVEGTPVDITQSPVTLCAVSAVTTRTPEQIESAAKGGSDSAAANPSATAAPPAEAGSSAQGDCTLPTAKSESGAAAVDAIEDLRPIEIAPITMSERHVPGSNVDVEFRFEGTEPLSVQVPITVPQDWVGERPDAE